jgi:hypothetical protein
MRTTGIRTTRSPLIPIVISTEKMIGLRPPEPGPALAQHWVVAGLLAGLGIMAIPGVGPVVAAGWLVSTLAGAAAGGAAGGVIGALTQAGIRNEDADIYAEGLRRGGAVVSARIPDRDAARLQAIMDNSAVNIGERAAAYRRAGWQSFNPKATPYTAEQIRKERELYMRR